MVSPLRGARKNKADFLDDQVSQANLRKETGTLQLGIVGGPATINLIYSRSWIWRSIGFRESL
jgi:hypothetical protein